jgi:hypothetical protein
MTAWLIFDESKMASSFMTDIVKRMTMLKKSIAERKINQRIIVSFFGFADQMSVHAPILSLPIV